ncbi:putative glycolipid-binding domain-containing protein [Idiomarina sp. HP20-50]|uniref:putative glycolipid-binding domain-containing protein n=1 Tax=Idiomarina sp. HP20-50 TaxID=3070813 RepID=UPI00294B5DC3|nr:putative glycolipid-binding domain-containing protein [Idiomarina sp. HP20-50]MDV6317271.1 putative glycolipid-binding domain-containing protein [Idiomarina sp. HP20-50]
MQERILWRKLENPGHEIATLNEKGNCRELLGTAVFSEEGKPCRIDYSVICDLSWATKLVNVHGVIGDKEIVIELQVDADKRWFLNGSALPELSGCLDVDIGFSPSTNLLPIRRLALNVGEEAEVKAAWLQFPSLELKVLLQVYRRQSENTYQYESAGGSFVSTLEVNDSGFVTNYPGLWQEEKNEPSADKFQR